MAAVPVCVLATLVAVPVGIACGVVVGTSVFLCDAFPLKCTSEFKGISCQVNPFTVIVYAGKGAIIPGRWIWCKH